MYPNNSQQEFIQKNIDACRYVYNWALETSTTVYKKDKTSLSEYDLNNRLKKLKIEHSFLKEVYSQSLQQSVRRHRKALHNFFRRVKQGDDKLGYPKFRSKRYHRQSFDIPQGVKVDFKLRRVYIPKIGHVKTVFHRRFKGTEKMCTVVSTNSGKFFICIVVDDGRIFPRKKRATQKNSVGIDVGLKTYATFSTGEKVENPRFLKSSLKRVKCLQRRMSRKKKGSRNREKAKIRLGKCHEKISNQRRDFQQKFSTKLIRENQGIMVESLNVRGMVRNPKLSQAISDAAWSSFLIMLKYKSELYGVTLIEVGKFEPTTKLCLVCGRKNNELTLSVREWICPQCKSHHDRDGNAAINIKMIGLKDYHASQELREEPVELPTVVGVKKQETHRLSGG